MNVRACVLGKSASSIITGSFCAMICGSAYSVTIQLPAGFELKTSASAELEYDDNVLFQSESPRADWVTTLSPRLVIERSSGATELSGTLSTSHGYFHAGTRDDYTDYMGAIDVGWKPVGYLSFQFLLDYADLNQQLNAVIDGGIASPIIEDQRSRRKTSEVSVKFGGETNRLGATLRAGERKERFTDVIRNRSLEYLAIEPSTQVSERIMLFAELMETDIGYQELAASELLDSTELSIVGGIDWSLPKTNFQVRAGKVEKAYTSDVQEDFSGPRWSISATWEPKSYSTLSIVAGQTIQEALGLAEFVSVKSQSASWLHNWTTRFSSNLSYGRSRGEFSGVDRENTIYRSTASFQFQSNRFILLSAGYLHIDSESGFRDLRLERGQYFLSIETPL